MSHKYRNVWNEIDFYHWDFIYGNCVQNKRYEMKIDSTCVAPLLLLHHHFSLLKKRLRLLSYWKVYIKHHRTELSDFLNRRLVSFLLNLTFYRALCVGVRSPTHVCTFAFVNVMVLFSVVIIIFICSPTWRFIHGKINQWIQKYHIPIMYTSTNVARMLAPSMSTTINMTRYIICVKDTIDIYRDEFFCLFPFVDANKCM